MGVSPRVWEEGGVVFSGVFVDVMGCCVDMSRGKSIRRGDVQASRPWWRLWAAQTLGLHTRTLDGRAQSTPVRLAWVLDPEVQSKGTVLEVW